MVINNFILVRDEKFAGDYTSCQRERERKLFNEKQIILSAYTYKAPT